MENLKKRLLCENIDSNVFPNYASILIFYKLN